MILTLALLLAGAGYPEGAPWGHAGAPQTRSCHTCHWDGELEAASPRLSLDGLPERFVPGERYELVVRLADASPSNGFQLAASAGTFEAVSELTEARGPSVRSNLSAGDWPIVWIAAETREPVTLWLAVNDANGDDSAFGDRVLLREFVISP